MNKTILLILFPKLKLFPYVRSRSIVFRHFSSQRWLERQRKDVFVSKAVSCNLRSRSAFKLKEIQEKFNVIKPSSFVVDLGAAPGG